MIEFEWDPPKARANLRKHGVAFQEEATVLRGSLAITIFDPDPSQEEDRYITIGASARGRILMVAPTDRGDRTRIMSPQELARAERQAYENEVKRRKGR